MSSVESVAMEAVEIDEFLASQRTGVLSLAKGDEGYGFPVSFAYDTAGHDVYLRLGYDRESEKRSYIDASDYASLVVYDYTDVGWKSVVARGGLEEIAESTLDATIVQAVRDLDIPFVSVFDDPDSDALEFRMTRLDVSELDGRKEPPGAT
jgi:nitroimidazol reductase NimA-like FMN-containing flavoprotein (pyridoxamine 5'-phosphate oxidase superfamily)